MAITVKIGDDERLLADTSEHWIADQLNRRGRDGTAVCVVVRIETTGVDVVLATPGCPAGPVGGRQANPREQELFRLWNNRKLNTTEFSVGSLTGFLNEVRKFA